MQQAVTLEIKKVRSGKRVYQYHTLRWIDPQTGKKKSQTLGRVDRGARDFITLTEAKKRRDMKAMEFHGNHHRRSAGWSLPDWLDYYRRTRQADGVKPATMSDIDFASRLLSAHFGKETPIRDIHRADARRFWIELTDGSLPMKVRQSKTQKKRQAPIGIETCKKHMRTIGTIFNRALLDGHVESNPFAKIAPTTPAASKWTYIPMEDFWKLYKQLDEHWQRVVLLARLTALSRIDIRHLTWDKLDLKASVLRITRHKTDIKQHSPIDETLAGLVAKWRRPTLKLGQDTVVKLENLSDVNAKEYLAVRARRAGIAMWDKPLHDLRKSCISDWARIQPSPTVLKLWAGHASIHTTLKFYDQVRASDMASGQGRVFAPSAAMGGQSPNSPPNPSAPA